MDGPPDSDRKLSLINPDETGEWGEILNDGTDGEAIEIRNPVKPPHALSVAERHRQAIVLKLAGASYATIAERLGYSSANKAKEAINKGMRNGLQESAKELRRIHYGRLEYLLMQVWPRASQGDQSAIHTSLNIMDRMAKLFGLDAPQQVDVTHNSRETIIIAEGERDQYLKALRAAAEIDVVEAEVIEEDEG